MMPNLLIALGAGAASALLFVAVRSAALFGFLLLGLAPVPILIVALAWSHWTGLAAAIIGTVALATVIHPLFALTFAIGIGLPAWWIGYLALLARPTAGPTPDGMEWYPVGRLVAWAAVAGTLMVVPIMLFVGGDQQSYNELRLGVEAVLRVQFQTPSGPAVPGLSEQQADQLIDLMVAMLPISAAMVVTFTNIVGLWLAARVAQVSGRLKRPWPDLPALQLPRFAAALLAVGCAGAALLDGLPRVLAGVLAASTTIAYAVLGFAVLHMITRGMASRGVMLGSAYAIVVVLVWPVLGIALLGLIDSLLDIRSRFTNTPPGPTGGA